MSILDQIKGFNKDSLTPATTIEKTTTDLFGVNAEDPKLPNLGDPKPAKHGHSNADDVIEYFDSEQELKAKIKRLAEMIKKSKHTVFYTGAGISTAAKIPDFRGPQGVWTLSDQGKSIKAEITIEQALPTFSHMCLVALLQQGKMAYLVSQNVDGLHRRSGIPEESLSELHGNCYKEICDKCGTVYLRDYDVVTHPGSDRHNMPGGQHITGRYCDNAACKGILHDSIINFGENLPQVPLSKAIQHSEGGDLAICMGTSLRVSPACNLPVQILNNGGNLVIWNLQKTPLDTSASLVIHTKCDDGMKLLMQELGIDVPAYKLKKTVLVGHNYRLVKKLIGPNHHYWKFYIKAEGDSPNISFISSVEITLPPTFNPSKITLNRPPFFVENVNTELLEITAKIFFTSFINKPPVELKHKVTFGENSCTPYTFELL